MLDPSAMLGHLAQVGIALTSVRDLDELLELIVAEARRFAGCDGGTVYIREGDMLRLAVWQNETLLRRDGIGGEVLHEGRRDPIGQDWLAGYVADTGEIVNLADVYNLPPGAPYRFNPAWDEQNDYRTRSMLVVPMADAEGSVVGVLQLVNSLGSDGQIVEFPRAIEPLVRSLASQAAVAIVNAQLDRQLREAHFDTILRLSVAAEYRDTDTAVHLHRMSEYSRAIALGLGLSKEEAELVRFSAPMHDIGKLGVPDAVLRKPGPLTPEEWAQMRDHTVIGARILEGSEAEVIKASAIVALTHHERWDGSGYPQGLAGNDIPLYGRIVALADAFDCCSSARVYKPPRSFDESVEAMRASSGTHFDPACVDAFIAAIRQVQQVYAAMHSGDGE